MASNSIIQYSSSSSREIIKTYHVFVSFRGDTRNNFTDHLFGALHRKGIHFFRDDTKLNKGKHILPELLQAIDGSQILVVVFSKKYASSKWCLRELEKIAGCINVPGKHVLPIFYDVTPSEVRNQSGNYEEAFDEYEKRFKEDEGKMEEVQRWRHALSQVGNLSGWDIGNKPQYGEIQKIVQNIQKVLQLNILCSSNDDLVGIESSIEELINLLLLDSDDVVLTVGICGMAGMGKTTLVTSLCERIHSYFNFHYFVEDVNNIFQNSNIFGLRNQLLCQAPEEKNSLEIYNVFPRTNLVSHGRRLIVLDNVGHIEQLEKLNLNHKCLSGGSRIIIISNDRSILEDYGVNTIYHVQPLNHDNANNLFCKYAFKDNCVMSEYEELKYDVLSYLEGHPLLTKVLGRHLADQDILQWRNALVKLRENPRKDILDKLRISFDGLEQNEKEIFLDIACFYGWYRKQNIMEVLQFRGFAPESGLKTLLKKSLITYYSKTMVEMPSLLIDLGKYIVKEKSPKEPRDWSRLWDWRDLIKVLFDNKAPKNLEAIVVEHDLGLMWETMKVDALSKLSQLKVLVLPTIKTFSETLSYLSNELGYLTWHQYPFKYLPLNFQPNNLVRLIIQFSSIKLLWKDTKALPNLKLVDLYYCRDLIKMPNFEEAPNLKWLNLGGCRQLTEIHPSVGSLKELTFLNLEGCINLVSLPTSLMGRSSLEYLNLSGCSNLYNTWSLEEPWLAKHAKKPCICEDPIHSQPTSTIRKKPFMPSANSLFSSPRFPCMLYLDLSFSNLHQIPDAIGNLCCLERLILRGNKFEKMPSLKKLWKLKYINLEHCKQLKYLFELPSQTHVPFEMCSQFWALNCSSIRLLESAGLNMFNCRKIVGSEEWSRMSISWQMQSVKKSLDYEFFHNFGSIIPGNEIPRWFDNQQVGTGNSIIVDRTFLRPDDNNWIGLAFCVVFCVSGLGNKSLPERERFICNIGLDVNFDLVTNYSDHIYIICFPRSSWEAINSDDIEIYFRLEYFVNWHFEVKKYGYCWVYESDIHLSNIPSPDIHLSNIPSNHCVIHPNRKDKFSQIKQRQ